MISRSPLQNELGTQDEIPIHAAWYSSAQVDGFPCKGSLPGFSVPRQMQTGWRQRADRNPGQHELVHVMVCTGTVAWEAPGRQECHPFVFPPLQLEKTNAHQITAGLVASLERHLFGELSIDTWLQTVAGKFSKINFLVVADSASANISLTWKLMSFLRQKGDQYNIITTCHFHPCCLHQMARIVDASLMD